MAVTQTVRFGGDLLGANGKVFDPSDGPVDYQTLRRHPFGLEGELELRGKNGGQSIVIPCRVFGPSFSAVRSTIRAMRAKQGTREKLSVGFGSGAGDSYGEVTLDQVSASQPRRIAFSTDGAAIRYQADVTLSFRKLHQED